MFIAFREAKCSIRRRNCVGQALFSQSFSFGRSYYNVRAPARAEFMTSILRKRLTFRGFIVWDFAAQAGDFYREAGQWLREGRIKYREDVVNGLENAPEAFLGLLKGKNFGKLLVKIA